MKIAVIVPTWNRRDNIIKTLKCLQMQEIQPQHSMQIIVVDDRSDDGTQKALEDNFLNTEPTILVQKLDKAHVWNASIPRNIGAKLTSPDTDALIFLDSDIMLPPDRIQRFIDDYLQDPDPNRVIIGPYHYMQVQLPYDISWWQRPIENYARDIRWPSFEEHPVEEKNTGISFALACFGGLLFVPRELFFKAGGYDEEMLSGVEDGEFGLRLARTGAVFSLDKGLLGWHHPHEVHPERTMFIAECVKKINIRYFGSEEPDYGLVEASKEAYKQWQVDWTPPESWVKENEN